MSIIRNLIIAPFVSIMLLGFVMNLLLTEAPTKRQVFFLCVIWFILWLISAMLMER